MPQVVTPSQPMDTSLAVHDDDKGIAHQSILLSLTKTIVNYLLNRRHTTDDEKSASDNRNCDKVENFQDDEGSRGQLCSSPCHNMTHDESLEETIEYRFVSDSESEMEKCRVSVIPKNNAVSVTVNSSNSRMRLAIGVLVRLLLPVANSLARGWQGLQGLRLLRILARIRESRGLLTALLAFAANTISMSLSSVQVVNRFDPLLRIIKLRKPSCVSTSDSKELKSTPSLEVSRLQPISSALLDDEQPEKCVTCVVVAEPPPGEPIKADIVFCHGLHGSLVNTWKQGLWKPKVQTKYPKFVDFQRPPKPPIRPPKRQRHSRNPLIIPAHHTKRRRLSEADIFDIRFEESDDEDHYDRTAAAWDCGTKRFTYECASPPPESEYVDDVEYSFPTFRLRIDDIENKTVHPEVPREETSDKDEEKKAYSPCWPGDWLPVDCPGVRVITLNYTTDPYLWRPLWIKKRKRSSLIERAREMSEMLIEKGVGEGRPIIWVGHSKGGIFIKQIIVDAWESGRPSCRNLFQSSRGCFFYSVPHCGSPLADFNLPLLRQSVELIEIKKNHPALLDLHSRFVALYRAGHLKIDVFSYVETALTLMSVLYLRIVGIDSADPGIGEVCGVQLDHREICKPRGRDCILYTQLVKMIKKNCF